MDIVYDLPFEAYFVINPETSNAEKLNLENWSDISGGDNNAISIEIEENDELDLYFNCGELTAKFYLDALECCPITPRIQTDIEGFVYCTPGPEMVKLYRSNSKYDALRVGNLQISVVVNNCTYVSFLKVIPKQLSFPEWNIMRDDLENEVKGLSQDIVRRNIGVGDELRGILPPDELYSFLLINRNAKEIMSSLLDIKDRPKYKLQKCYEEVDESCSKEVDTQTVKLYLRKGAPNGKFTVPRRIVVYDIQENRLLKRIIKAYDENLDKFIMIITSTLEYRCQQSSKNPNPSLYDIKYIEGLNSYLDTARKLKKITNIIKNVEWFKDVKTPQDVYIPHSFAIDSRYGTLYRLFMQMNNKDFSVKLDPQYSYSWKKSSSLYEMWCYICVCREFLQHGYFFNTSFDNIFVKDHLFPVLKTGSKIIVENEKAKIEIVYDILLPMTSKKTQLYNNPLYMTGITGRHHRPDICINIYSKRTNWYIGSYIIECKYRKLKAILGSTWSSKEQVIAYHNDSKSSFFYNGYLDKFSSTRPVHHVMVFTPDVFEQLDSSDDMVSYLTFRPTENRDLIRKACEPLFSAISENVERADMFRENLF